MKPIEWVEAQGHARRQQRPALLRLALQQRPDSSLLHYQLGTALLESGSATDAAECFRRSLELAPDDADALLGLGKASAELGLPDTSVECFRKAAATGARPAESHFRLGAALARAGVGDEAIAALRVALDANPVHYNALHLLTRLLMAHDDPDGALAACEGSLRRAPGNSAALAAESLVLLERGDRAEAARLLDFDRFVRVARPPVPPGFADHASFLRTLADSIRANAELRFEPEGRTARGGSRADLAPAPHAPEALVSALMRDAVQEYRVTLERGSPHEFLAAAPVRASLSMWTNVLQPGGYHTPHVHPAAWLSGVFYVNVPAGGAQAAGELELGCSSVLFRRPIEPLVTRVCPEAGVLVLFPSYLYHRTLPTQGPEERISIAFDVVSTA